MNNKDDQNRLLIATFIVGTTIAIMFAQIHTPIDKHSWITIIIGAFLLGLITSAIFAFLYILAKGYELRIKAKKKLNFIDKYNFLLYNLSVWVYAPVSAVLITIYILGLLDEGKKQGNIWATIGFYVLAMVIILIVNLKSIKGLVKDVHKPMSKK